MFKNEAHEDWPPQICEIVDGAAVYFNASKVKSISHPKYAHFQTLPVIEFSLAAAKNMTGKHKRRDKTPLPLNLPDPDMALIKVNNNILNEEQKDRIKMVHQENQEVFNNDLSGGYNQMHGRHYGSFSFKDQNKPPTTKMWAPQYNRGCADLHQAKCDELEQQGVLVDPKELDIDILHVSPSFIQQKGRAKHKKLN